MELKPLLQNKAFIPLVLTVFVLIVFSQAVSFDFVNYDDHKYISRNPHIAEGLNLKSLSWAVKAGLGGPSAHADDWQPLTVLSRLVDMTLFGNNPAGHHAMNLFFHWLNTLLVFFLLSRVTGDAMRSGFVALFFAVHPIQIEAVSWITSRKDLFSTSMALVALIFYTRGHLVQRGMTKLGVVTFTLLALLAKPVWVVLPCIFLLWDYWTGKGFKKKNALHEAIVSKWHLWLLSFVMGMVTLSSQHHVLESIPWFERVFRGFTQALFYLYKVMVPTNMGLYGPIPSEPILMDRVVVSFSVLVIISLLTFFFRNRIRSVWVGWLWFLITLLPLMSLKIPADRYMYAPVIGLAMMICLTKAIPLKVLLVLSLTFGFLSFSQVPNWANSISLMNQALEINDKNYKAHYNLGFALEEVGDVAQARRHYEEAIRLEPKYSMAWNQLGKLFYDSNDLLKASAYYKEAIEHNARFAEAHYNLSLVYFKQKKLSESLEELKKALRIHPDYENAKFNYEQIHKLM